MLSIKSIKRGFTLVEVVLTVILFSLIVIVFSTAMFTLYKNSRAEYSLSKEMYRSVEELELAANRVKDLDLKMDYTSNTTIDYMDKQEKGKKRKEFFLTTYPKLNKNSKVKDIVNEIKKQTDVKVDNIQENKEFTIFSSKYQCKVKGYSISKSIFTREDGESKKFLYFIPNTDDRELKYPEYEYVKLIEEKSKNTPLYLYFNTIEASSFQKKLKGDYKIVKDTKVYLHHENFLWEVTKESKSPDGEYYQPVFNPQFNSSIPESSYNTEYPIDSTYFKELNSKKVELFVKKEEVKPLRDFYLRFKLEPISLTKVKAPDLVTDSVWVIALPVIKDLYYHFDMAFGGGFLDRSGSASNSSVVENQGVPNLVQSLNPGKSMVPIKANKSGNDLLLYKGEKYGKYLKLSNNNKEYVFKTDKQPEPKEKPEFLTLFMVLDTKDASPGDIIKRVHAPKTYINEDVYGYLIRYEGTNGSTDKFSISSGKESVLDSTKAYFEVPKKDGKHILMAILDWGYKYSNGALAEKKNWTKYNKIAVDFLSFESKEHKNDFVTQNSSVIYVSEKDLDRDKDSSLYLGGAKDLKVYEIIGYSSLLNDAELKQVYNYLANKYELTPLP